MLKSLTLPKAAYITGLFSGFIVGVFLTFIVGFYFASF